MKNTLITVVFIAAFFAGFTPVFAQTNKQYCTGLLSRVFSGHMIMDYNLANEVRICHLVVKGLINREEM